MDKSSFLAKHTAAIHICNVLTITQRKVINILLKEAFPKLNKDIIHNIPLAKVLQFLGWKSTSETTKFLRNSLKDLNIKQIEWNIFNKDKTSIWGVTTLLAYVQIKDGVIEYTYSKPLREMLHKPNIYARLDLTIQKHFSNKHALAIWEYLSECLCSSKANSILTQPMELNELRRFLGLLTCKSYCNFFLFNSKVIRVAISEINSISDINVKCHFTKDGKNVTAITFEASRNNYISYVNTPLPLLEKNLLFTIYEAAQYLGVSKGLVSSQIAIHGETKVEDVLKRLQKEKENGNKIRSVNAYFLYCLKVNFENGSGDDALVEDISEPDFMALAMDDPKQANRLRLLCEKIGVSSFQGWFQNVEFHKNESNQLFVRTSSKFFADYIQTRFSGAILEAWQESGENIKDLEILDT